jgi:predicted ester cyclase
VSAANIEIVRDFIEQVWNEGNVHALDRLLAPMYRDHGPLAGLTGEGIAQFVCRLRNIVPDLHVAATYLPAGDERVNVHWTAHGTHAVLMGGLTPTGRPIRYTGATAFRLADGMIVESWTMSDELGLLRQLGVQPALSLSE